VFAERWMPSILRELLRGSTTFNDLHRGVPRMSRSLPSGRLNSRRVVSLSGARGRRHSVPADARRRGAWTGGDPARHPPHNAGSVRRSPRATLTTSTPCSPASPTGPSPGMRVGSGAAQSRVYSVSALYNPVRNTVHRAQPTYPRAIAVNLTRVRSQVSAYTLCIDR